jgi:Flp pilus assembly pilin Flp
MLAHQACDRLVIDDHALGVKLTSDAAVAVAWELGTQRLNAVAPFSPPPCAVVRSARGQTMTEYALVLAAVAVAVYGVYRALGNNIGSLANGVNSTLTNA